MKKLSFILLVWMIMSVTSPVMANKVRGGFCEFFEIAPNSSQTILTVPEGKRFILLKLYPSIPFTNCNWELTINGDLFIDGYISYYQQVHDFPDQCVVINSGETLGVKNFAQDMYYNTLRITVIGYFEEDVEIIPGPEGPQGPQGEQGQQGLQGEQGPPGITPEEIFQLQAQLIALQQANIVLQQQIQAIEQQNIALQQMINDNRYLLEQLPQLRKELEDLMLQVQAGI